MVQTRAAGIKLPMDDFVAEFKLDEVEREIVELLLVAATDLTKTTAARGCKSRNWSNCWPGAERMRRRSSCRTFCPEASCAVLLRTGRCSGAGV